MADMSSCELDLANGIKKKCHSNDLNVIEYRKFDQKLLMLKAAHEAKRARECEAAEVSS